MKRTFVAVYDGETLRPQEPVDLTRNVRYRVTVEENGGGDVTDEERPLMRLLTLAQDLDLPEDYAAQVDHYLYGHPKR
jgi:hypothetical protein